MNEQVNVVGAAQGLYRNLKPAIMISFVFIQVSPLKAETGIGKSGGPGHGVMLPSKHAFPQRNVELETAFSNAHAFAEEAKRQGIVVTELEVTNRLELYQELYPQQALDESKTKRMLLAEKYLETNGFGSDDEELERAAREKVDSFRFYNPENAQMAERAARFEVLLVRKETVREGGKLNDLAQIKRASERASTPMWSLEDVRVLGESDECMAWKDDVCFVSLSEFNAAAVYHRVEARTPLVSARKKVLHWYMLQKNLAEIGRERGLHQNLDSILHAQKQSRAGKRWIHLARNFGIPVQDMGTLQALYENLYWKHFSAADIATLSIVGSSDSGYVDSIYNSLVAWTKLQKDRKSVQREPALPWISHHEDDLPAELVAVTDTFHLGQTSAPMRTRLGYFLIRLSKLERRKEVSFDDAFPQLTFIATRNKFLKMDSVLESQAMKFYLENKADYALPDTMDLMGWLIPTDASQGDKKHFRRQATEVVPDTTLYKPLALSSLVLDRETQLLLQRRAQADPQKTFFGPLSGKYGKWYFKIRSRKPAYDTIPYRLARTDIIRRISNPLPDLRDKMEDDEFSDQVLLTMGLAVGAKRMEFQQYGRPGVRELHHNLGYNIPNTSTSESEHTQILEQIKAQTLKRRDERARKDESFLKSTKINFAKLRD